MWLVLAMLRPEDVKDIYDIAPDRVGLVSMVMYGIHFGYCPLYETEKEAEQYFPDIKRTQLPIPILKEEENGDEE